MPAYAPKFAHWLPKSERDRLSKAPHAERNAWAKKELLGVKNLHRCFEVGLRELAQARRSCSYKAGLSWYYGMFSMYGTGNTCNAGGFALKRSATYTKFWSQRKDANVLAGFDDRLLKPVVSSID